MEKYIQRCFDLARLGAGRTDPNPLVGAVLVYQNRIIGEGYHQKYGGAHAEVNAVNAVSEIDRPLIAEATLYVSLEPCNIYGRTPPCTDLILERRIPRVVVSHRDYTPGVNGSGLKRLRRAGVEVIENILPEKGKWLSLPRNTFVRENRPYILLKYAQTKDGKLAPSGGAQYWISGPVAKRLVHKWRSETAAILVGTNTVVSDNPALTNRYYFGPSPTRVILDRTLRLPANSAVFDGSVPTLIFCEKTPEKTVSNTEFIQINFAKNSLQTILSELAERNLSTLMVEGGAALLTSLISRGLWDEARVIIGNKQLPGGLDAPVLPVQPKQIYQLDQDELRVFFHPRHGMQAPDYKR